ncbi:LacI family DNA-binding transcriptional regulator [Streptomyces heilongjiangensis]
MIEAVDALGYQPHRAARSMRSQRTMQIGYHVFREQLDVRNGFTLGFLQALVTSAAQRGYHVVVFTHPDGALLDAFEGLIAMRSVDAFVLSDSRFDDPRARFLAERKIPFSSLGRMVDDLPQQWVDIDNTASMASMIDYLTAAGHRDFAYITRDHPAYWLTERLQGFREGMGRNGHISSEKSLIRASDQDLRGEVQRLLTRERRPTALVCCDDITAATVCNIVRSEGLEVGRDVAVTGFDGGAIQQINEPTLTSVRIPVETIAEHLIERCLRELEHGPTGEPGLVIDAPIVRGRSA